MINGHSPKKAKNGHSIKILNKTDTNHDLDFFDPPKTSVAEDAKIDEALDEIAVKFICNNPPDDRKNQIPLFFHLEEANWYYHDFYTKQFGLPELEESDFIKRILARVPSPKLDQQEIAEFLKKFQSYKRNIPVCCALIFNEKRDKILFVEQFNQPGQWVFPGGKINKDESEMDCALREMKEEIGFDGKDYANANQFIQFNTKDKKIKAFIFEGIPEKTYFETQTRNEIGHIRWIRIADLEELSKNGYSFRNIDNWLPLVEAHLKKENSSFQHNKGPSNSNYFNCNNNVNKAEPDLAAFLQPKAIPKTFNEKPKVNTFQTRIPTKPVSNPQFSSSFENKNNIFEEFFAQKPEYEKVLLMKKMNVPNLFGTCE